MKKKLCLALLLCAVLLASAAYAEHEDHHFGSWKTKRNASCRDTGLQFRYCTGCDHWEKRELAKLPHTPGEWTITAEPTCTKKGSKESTCTECGARIRYSIDMLEHAYGDMVIVQEPTCTKDGRGEYTCADCGGKKTEKIPKLGHDWGEITVIKEPTCKKLGSGEVTCQRCGGTQTTKIEKLEHEWGEWTVTREPSGKNKGTRVRTCALCGETVSERFYWEGTLYEDMPACEEVMQLQQMLKDLGYYKGNIRTGKYGSLTGEAVAKYQKDHGLDETTVADPTTLESIAGAWEAETGKSASEIVVVTD